MTRTILLQSDRTRNQKSETGKRIALMLLLMKKLRYMKQIRNDRQRILDEMPETIQQSIRFVREKENSAYTERIAETKSEIMQEINSTYIQWISSLLKRKLQKTMEGKLFGQSIRPFGQKILFDQKEWKNGTNRKYSGSVESIGRIQNGTDLRIWISTLVFSPKNSRYSEAFT